MRFSDKNLLLFDADDTIFDFRRAEHTAVGMIARDLGIGAEGFAEEFSRVNLALWKAFERGEVAQEEIVSRRFEILFPRYGIRGRDPLTVGLLYKKYLGMQAFLIEGMTDLLEKLVGNKRLFLITNGTATTQRSRIAATGIGRYFENIFISEEIGCRKPHAAFFEYVAAHIDGFGVEDALIVGDSLTSDIALANAAGAASVWFNPYGEINETPYRPDREVGSARALEALLLSE